MYKPKGKNGGARPGAGRKKGGHNKTTIDQLHGKQLMIKMVLRELYPIINAQILKAKGEIYAVNGYDIVKDNTGQVLQKSAIVYKQAPDNFSAKMLLEYVFGKPKETVDMTVNNPDAVNSIDNLSDSIKRILEAKHHPKIPTQNIQPIKAQPVKVESIVDKEEVKPQLTTIDPKAILENNK